MLASFRTRDLPAGSSPPRVILSGLLYLARTEVWLSTGVKGSSGIRSSRDIASCSFDTGILSAFRRRALRRQFARGHFRSVAIAEQLLESERR